MSVHKSYKESAKNLFQFLRELSDLKTKKVLDVNNFEKVLWLDQTPKEKRSLLYHTLFVTRPIQYQ